MESKFTPRLLANKYTFGVLGAVILGASPALATTIEIGASMTSGGAVSVLNTGSNTGVDWSGSYGGLSYNLVGASDPTPSGPVSRFSSTLLNSSTGGASGTVYFYVTETGLTSARAAIPTVTSFTENLLPKGWSVMESTYLDTSNTPFGMGAQLGSVTTNGVYAQDFPASTTSASGPFSLTEVYQVNFSANEGTALSSEKIQTVTTGVPELSTWAMMLLGFSGLGFVGYRSRRTADAV